MRIIAGKHRSRILVTLEGENTRPMMDVMKESVFNTLGQYFSDDLVLDLFGGSGALSLEAISRGAKHAYISEISKDACNVINKNIKALHEEDSVTLMQCDYNIALSRLKDMKFDLIFLDPPYRLNIVNEIIDKLIELDMINDNGYIICHYVTGNSYIDTRFKLVKNYAKGKHEVAIYKKE